MNIGDYRIEIIPDTEFRLDGGAMFGVVPRVLWEKVCPPDAQNRIKMASDCLFVETASEKILIETGMGEKWTEKLHAIYGIRREKTFAESLFDKTGYRCEDISIVVNTHLHFDHCGGNTIYEDQLRMTNDELRETDDRQPATENRKLVPQFPNARYFVSENEFKHAENPYERDRASYISDNWTALKKSGQLELKPSVYEVAEGITMTEMRGHNGSMQTVKIERSGEILYSFSDVLPTTHHIPLPWIMGYDLFPLETLENKKRLLPQAVEENWLCWFYHDAENSLCRLTEIDGKLKAVKL